MKRYNYPPGYNFIQSIERTYKQIKDPIGSMQESMRRHNGTYSVYLGRRHFIVTQDAGFIEYVLKGNHRNYHKSEIQSRHLGQFLGNGLLTSNADFWLRQRRLIQPGFHAEKIASLYEIIGKTSAGFLDNFPQGESVDLYPLMNNLAFRIVINTLFNVPVSRQLQDELGSFVSETQNFVIKDLRNPHKSWWYRLSGEARNNFRLSARARDIIRQLIRERKASGIRAGDLLDMLLEARYEDNGEPMQEEQMIDEILVLIIAGHETTANALTWTLYLLATHPEELERCAGATAGMTPQQSATNEILYAVIREAMRLYPPAWISDRVSLNEDTFGPWSFPGNTIIILFYYGLHRNPQLWADAEKFLPSRFASVKDKSRFYFPFGAGPRMCIGNNFAMAEMAIFLQAFLERFSIAPVQQVPKMNALVTLKPVGVFLRVQKR